MRILIITKYAWDDKIASGNTLSNFFSNWQDTTFYTVYCRDGLPSNTCCNHYYSVSPINLIKNLFTPWRIGRVVNLTNRPTTKADNAEGRLTEISKFSSVFTYIYDTLYTTRLWLNKRLKTYIKEANPDVVFCFGVTDAFNYYLIKYIKSNVNKPIVSYFVDDLYKTDTRWWHFFKRSWNNRLIDIARFSTKRYAISRMMCEEYSMIMERDFDLITKGCIFGELKQKNNNPMKITYAGNLLYGRDKTLIKLVSLIQSINQVNKVLFHLDIFTATQLDNQKKSLLNIEGCSTLHTPVSYDEIRTIQSESDIVLYVESFVPEQIKVVRLSFSTKVTDCLQSGSMVLAIGPKTIATIQYLESIPGVVVSDIDSLQFLLNHLSQNPKMIAEYAVATNMYARNNLSVSCTRQHLQNDFLTLITAN